MPDISLTYALALAALLLVIGLAGVLARRDLVFLLMAVAIMLNAAGLAFVAAGARWGQSDGQVMFILVLCLGAALAGIGLALLREVLRRFGGRGDPVAGGRRS